jgi:ankyrin repeat protein
MDLILAASNGNLDKVQKFIADGIDVNFLDIYCQTALLYASRNNHLEIVHFLIKSGANCNIINYYGTSALDFAVMYGNQSVIQVLVQNGIKINTDHNPILNLAVTYGRFDVIKYLVHNGANIHVVDCTGATAKMVASKNNYTRIVQFLTHVEIVDITIALSPLELSPYVLLWIVQWVTQIKDCEQLRVLRLIEGIQRSRSLLKN